MKKLATIGACLAISSVMALGVAFSPSAYAMRGVRVDCSKVMKDLNGGKKPKEVAAGMKISISSVYKCRRRARQAAGAGTAHAMNAHPMAAASPAAAKH
ncbi:MAG TPA: hypothetical protein VMV15_02090 [Candidatus Binataceae bacterium]|nr:hypothetical protein [Candidatus Binataceae bacterium]